MASAAREAESQTFHFRRPFFLSFFGRTKKEKIKLINDLYL
jgi:hypothetical protein